MVGKLSKKKSHLREANNLRVGKKTNKSNKNKNNNNSRTPCSEVKKATMELTGKKSMKKSGVWREIEFPLSKKMMFVPDTPDTKNSVVAQAHFKGRRWEPKIAELLTKHGKEGTTAIDMGAYIGTHTMSLVDVVGPKGKVVTFEPQPWAHDCIKKTLQKNGIKNVNVINAGVSDKKGKIRFCSDASGSSSVCQERRPSAKWKEVYDIPIITLDSLKLKNVSVMKIDVEGHELNALKGGRKTIVESKPVILLEVWSKRKTRLNNVKAFLKSINYKMQHISGDDYICTPI